MDEPISPGKILLRLEELRKWQKLQEERLVEQQALQRKQLEEAHNRFLHETLSNCSQYDTLDSSTENSSFSNCNLPKEIDKRRTKLEDLSNLVDGVSALNISRESEPILSPVLSSIQSNQSNINMDSDFISDKIDYGNLKPPQNYDIKKCQNVNLEEVPIIPKAKDFDTLIKNKLENDNTETTSDVKVKAVKKKPFLKRGQGMTRFNMSKKDIGLKNQGLPWKKPVLGDGKRLAKQQTIEKTIDNKLSHDTNVQQNLKIVKEPVSIDDCTPEHMVTLCESVQDSEEESGSESKSCLTRDLMELFKTKQSWASVLTREQEQYIKLLGQTDKYKQFFHADISMCSSTASPINKLREQKELAEQKVFDLLENKVHNSSFSSNSSLVQKIIGSHGTDTPTASKEFIKNNPNILNLNPALTDLKSVQCLNSSQSSLDCVDEEISEGKYSDTDDYSESTDSEPTCKEVLKDKPILLTSTPNQVAQNDTSKQTSTKDKVIKIVISEDTNLSEDSEAPIEDTTVVQDDNCLDMTGKAEMLKARLQDLQNEIQVFQRENDIVGKMKQELEEEREKFLREKADIERKIHEDKIVAEYYLAEEREKLAKQKALYDRHVKDMKNQSSKKDREEIASLKKEINDLKESIKVRDSKNGAMQARLRNQVKCLERDKEELKFEIDKLKKENTRLQNASMRSRRLSNIKCLAEINRALSQTTISNRSDDFDVDDTYHNKTISTEYLEDEKRSGINRNKNVIKPSVVRHTKPFKRTKSAPNLTSRYAKYFSERDEADRQNAAKQLGYGLESDQDLSDDDLQYNKFNHKNRSSLRSDYRDNHYEFNEGNQRKSLDSKDYRENHYEFNKDNQRRSFERLEKSSHSPNIYPKVDYYERKPISKTDNFFTTLRTEIDNFIDVSPKYPREFDLIDKRHEKPSVEVSPKYPREFDVIDKRQEKPLSHEKDYNSNPVGHQNGVKSSTDHVIINNEDGSKEVRFSNGNTKVISADGNYTKFLYYNGDIKETFYKEGTIKYFYKEVNVHHTTYKDGSQLLQFPDGQVERRYPDGSVESQLSDGATRWAKAGGVQEWKFPDGTVLVVSAQGDRTLRFPNGQVEVHTKEYKRREFPDGTVKVVYADGVVETRFANGRIRVKDKQDRVFLDSATNNVQQQTRIS